jgi:hypothetical protein
MFKEKRGQVWIETVIYTLIALSLITASLIFINPKIEEMRDSATNEKMLNIMQEIDSTIDSISRMGSGNKRTMEIKIDQGEFEIDGKNEKIYFEIESNSQFSQEKKEIKDRRVFIKTEEISDKYLVSFRIDYDDKYNLTVNNEEISKKIPPSPTFYKLSITNLGKAGNETRINIDIN